MVKHILVRYAVDRDGSRQTALSRIATRARFVDGADVAARQLRVIERFH
jgi:hypothetical protein